MSHDNLWMLIASADEITRLREQNRVLAAQVGVLEIFATALGMRRGGEGAEIDLVWKLRKRIDEIQKEQATPAQDP